MKGGCLNLAFLNASSMTLQMLNMVIPAVFMAFHSQRLNPLELRWTNWKIGGK